MPYVSGARPVCQTQRSAGPHRHQERLRSTVPRGAAAGADRRISRSAPGASPHRAEVGRAGPLARGASRALSRAPASQDSIRADGHCGQLQTDGETAWSPPTAAACLTGIPPPLGCEARGAHLGLLATRAYAFKPCGADYFRGVLCSGMAEHSADFLSDLLGTCARARATRRHAPSTESAD